MVLGADRIARMLLGLEAKFGHPFTYAHAEINGEPAIVQYVGGRVFGVTFCDTDGERIRAMYRVLDPDKLTRVP